jgi:hypothetical protein
VCTCARDETHAGAKESEQARVERVTSGWTGSLHTTVLDRFED